MVKIQAFRGFTYKPEDYESLLRFDHQTLNNLVQNKRAYINKVPIIDQIQTGLLEKDNDAFVYIYRQVFRGNESLGLMVELDLKVEHFIFRKVLMEKLKFMKKLFVEKGIIANHILKHMSDLSY